MALRFNSASIILAAVFCCYSSAACFSAGAKPAKRPAKETRLIDRLKPSEAVDALINRNPAPRLVELEGGRNRPEFPKDYNWAESSRIGGLLREVGPDIERLWPELVKHLGDERYCVSIEWESGTTYNWTVGYVCQRLITTALHNAYLNSLQPLRKQQYQRLAAPDFAKDQKTLKAWCEARKDKKLYELQVEACRWMISDINKADRPAVVSDAEKKEWIKRIESNIDTLNKQKKATPTTSVIGDSYRLFGKERAEKENLIAPEK